MNMIAAKPEYISFKVGPSMYFLFRNYDVVMVKDVSHGADPKHMYVSSRDGTFRDWDGTPLVKDANIVANIKKTSDYKRWREGWNRRLDQILNEYDSQVTACLSKLGEAYADYDT